MNPQTYKDSVHVEVEYTVSKERDEPRKQDKARLDAGEVVPGSGTPGKPKRMAQMVSVRVPGELIGRLKPVCEERAITLSQALREGAELMAKDPAPIKPSTCNQLWLFREKLASLERSADETKRWAKKAGELLEKELREAEEREKL